MPTKGRITSARTELTARSAAVLLAVLAVACGQEPEPSGSAPLPSTAGIGSTSASAEPAAPAIPTYVLAPPPAPSASASSSPAVESEAIAKAVVDYKVAVAKRDGARAAELVSASTHAYFETLRKAALSMQESELRKQPLMDKVLVLTLRANVAADELRKTDGRGLFIYAVKNKMMMGEAQKVDAKAIEQSGDEAWVGVVTDGQKLGPREGFRVVRESTCAPPPPQKNKPVEPAPSSCWLVDAMSISNHEYVIDLIKKSVPQGEDFDTAWVKFLEEATNKKLPDIWKPTDP